MLVRDIYGGGAELIGLPGDIIASSFGKIQNAMANPSTNTYDYTKSLLLMMAFNVSQIATVTAKICGIDRIVLVGYYLEMPGYLSTMQQCIQYWSQGSVKLKFVRIAPMLGAFGASTKPLMDNN
eukprot:Trichotokara_eunicae@DN2136_c0_g1_i1.p1